MPNFPTIQSFFPTVPGPKNLSKTPPINNRYSDGFDGILESPATPWTPKRGGTYVPTKIGLINTGPGRISFIGRVANFREVEKSSKVDTAAKVLLRMALADDTGVIEIKFWLTRPAPATKLVVLGALATVHATFVAALSPAERETSAANQMVSISDTDSTANVEFHETTDENWADFRIPVGASGEDPLVGLMPLRVFVESGSDVGGARLLVCVKWKGAKKTLLKKDGTMAEKREIGIFDDTMEATLTLWGSATSSAASWEISKTVLLLTSPAIKLWKKDVQISLAHSSLIDIDPLHRDGQWLRNYAQKLLRKPNICQPFPFNDFDWDEGLYGKRRIKYTFADIDKYSRNLEPYSAQLPTGQCVGWINVMIVEMNVSTNYRRNMLLCGTCCGFTVFSNLVFATCKKCEEPIASMTPNPNIVAYPIHYQSSSLRAILTTFLSQIGRLSDETGCVSGANLLWTEQAWQNLLGRSVEELAENTSIDILKYFDDFFLFTRINLAFGWSPDVGKIAVWDVGPS